MWRNDALVFSLNGAGVCNKKIKAGRHKNSTSSQYSGSASRSYRGSATKGHIPTTTVRDKDLFSQVSGVSQTVTTMAQNMLNTLTKRASTSDPFNNQEDSLFFGHLMGAGGTDLPENRSIDRREPDAPSYTEAVTSGFVRPRWHGREPLRPISPCRTGFQPGVRRG